MRCCRALLAWRPAVGGETRSSVMVHNGAVRGTEADFAAVCFEELWSRPRMPGRAAFVYRAPQLDLAVIEYTWTRPKRVTNALGTLAATREDRFPPTKTDAAAFNSLREPLRVVGQWSCWQRSRSTRLKLHTIPDPLHRPMATMAAPPPPVRIARLRRGSCCIFSPSCRA